MEVVHVRVCVCACVCVCVCLLWFVQQSLAVISTGSALKTFSQNPAAADCIVWSLLTVRGSSVQSDKRSPPHLIFGQRSYDIPPGMGLTFGSRLPQIIVIMSRGCGCIFVWNTRGETANRQALSNVEDDLICRDRQSRDLNDLREYWVFCFL